MSAAYTIRVRKFLSNPLLERKQFVLEVLHPERANVSKSELKEKLSKLFKVADDKCIILFGFQTAFGGGRSSGFGLIYDSLAACQKFEKRYVFKNFLNLSDLFCILVIVWCVVVSFLNVKTLLVAVLRRISRIVRKKLEELKRQS
jgi:ribosomal protein S24E